MTVAGPTYTVKRTTVPAGLRGLWDAPPWASANTLEVALFHAKSSSHRPRTRVRLLHDDAHIYLIFQVKDRFVRSVHVNYQDPVCQDSCVEFFVEPLPGKGYFNFEFNAGGTMLLSHILDATPAPGGFKDFSMVKPEVGRKVKVFHSLPRVVDPEMTNPVVWTLEASIPVSIFDACLKETVPPLAGRTWRANFYKCGDKTSHPHWASWAQIEEKLAFHVPHRFAPISFGG